MNRGVFHSSLMQEMMMGGNPNWWNMNSMKSTAEQQSSPNFFPLFTPTSSSSSLPVPSFLDCHDLPESWSQLLLSGLVGSEEHGILGQLQGKKIDNWEDQQILSHVSKAAIVDVKQEVEQSYVYGNGVEDFQSPNQSWSQMMSSSSPQSCVTSFSSNVLDFSSKNKAHDRGRHLPPSDPSSECNSPASGGTMKKARVQSSSTQSTIKVRKEKLGERISSLHQLVSPFGKTDTASVLLEAIGYIRFLQRQVEVLSLPYLNNGSANVQGEKNCIFPEDPGQLLNENSMKRNGIFEQKSGEEPKKGLRSRGLCLVPVSSTMQLVGSENGADYWAPALSGGGFR